MEYSTVEITKEASDENRRKATEARHGGVKGDLGSTAAVGRLDLRGPLGQAGLRPGRQALDAVMLERGRLVVESVMQIERAEIAGPDYDPSDLVLQKRAHEEGSIFVGGQKGRVPHLRLRHVVKREAPKPSYVLLHSPGQFSEELLKKTLRGVSAQKQTSPSSIRRRHDVAAQDGAIDRSNREPVLAGSAHASGMAHAHEGARCSSGGCGACGWTASSRASA